MFILPSFCCWIKYRLNSNVVLRTAQFLQISGLVEENGSSRSGFVLTSLALQLSIKSTVFLPMVSREEQQAKEKVCSSGGGGKRKLISGEVGGRKLVTVLKLQKTIFAFWQLKARKEGVEGSKSEEEGVTLKSEPVDIGTHSKATNYPGSLCSGLNASHIFFGKSITWN